jgi:hypothetical protein
VLFLSEATVKAHVCPMLARLDLNNRVQIAMLVYDARGFADGPPAVPRSDGRLAAMVRFVVAVSSAVVPASDGTP